MQRREILNSLLSIINLRIVRESNQEFVSLTPHWRAGTRWRDDSVPKELRDFVKTNLQFSFSQVQQDLFAAWVINEASRMKLVPKRPYFFVEFGATNGYKLSNTFYLEKIRNWNGILCEPARIWQEELVRIRSCAVDFRCVYSKSGMTLSFSESTDPELGTLSEFRFTDEHSNSRKVGKVYEVLTVSLLDLLEGHKAPLEIDYLSVDTEGSEFEILKNFNFNKYSFNVITVEHNFTPKREQIFSLLSSHGYLRVLSQVSEQDDWYIHKKLAGIFTK